MYMSHNIHFSFAVTFLLQLPFFYSYISLQQHLQPPACSAGYDSGFPPPILWHACAKAAPASSIIFGTIPYSCVALHCDTV